MRSPPKRCSPNASPWSAKMTTAVFSSSPVALERVEAPAPRCWSANDTSPSYFSSSALTPARVDGKLVVLHVAAVRLEEVGPQRERAARRLPSAAQLGRLTRGVMRGAAMSVFESCSVSAPALSHSSKPRGDARSPARGRSARRRRRCAGRPLLSAWKKRGVVGDLEHRREVGDHPHPAHLRREARGEERREAARRVGRLRVGVGEA